MMKSNTTHTMQDLSEDQINHWHDLEPWDDLTHRLPRTALAFAEKHPRCAFKTYRRAGKTRLLLLIAAEFMRNNPGAHVLYFGSGPDMRDGSIEIGVRMYTLMGDLHLCGKGNILYGTNGSCFEMIGSRSSPSTKTAQLVLIDECAFMLDSYIDNVVLPVMDDNPNARLIVASTPSPGSGMDDFTRITRILPTFVWSF